MFQERRLRLPFLLSKVKNDTNFYFSKVKNEYKICFSKVKNRIFAANKTENYG